MDEEDLQQKNKGHNSMRDKLKKKRKNQKEQKKLKSLQKKKYNEIREDKRAEFFGKKESNKERKLKYKDKYGINQKKLFKNLDKFTKIFTDDISEFLDIFQVLDEGEEVDVNDMENPKIKKLLGKIFKRLKISESKQVYTKKQKCKVENLYQYMTKKYQEYKEKKGKSDSDSDSNSDSDNQGNQSDSESEVEMDDQQKKKLIQQSIDPVEPIGPTVNIRPSMGPSRPEGIQTEPENQKTEQELKEIEEFKKQIDTLVEVKKNPKRDDWMTGDLDNFMNKAFEGVQDQNKLKNFLNHRQKPSENQAQKQAKKLGEFNNYAEGSARLEDTNEEQNQQKVQDFMKQYDQQFRQKSLLELHQEKQQQLKQQKNTAGKGGERKMFDKEKDMQFSKVDSKRLFETLKEKDVLKSKFQSAGANKKFMQMGNCGGKSKQKKPKVLMVSGNNNQQQGTQQPQNSNQPLEPRSSFTRAIGPKKQNDQQIQRMEQRNSHPSSPSAMSEESHSNQKKSYRQEPDQEPNPPQQQSQQNNQNTQQLQRRQSGQAEPEPVKN